MEKREREREEDRQRGERQRQGQREKKTWEKNRDRKSIYKRTFPNIFFRQI